MVSIGELSEYAKSGLPTAVNGIDSSVQVLYEEARLVDDRM